MTIAWWVVACALVVILVVLAYNLWVGWRARSLRPPPDPPNGPRKL